MVQRRALKVDLEDEYYNKFLKIKDELGLSSNAETMRYLINFYLKSEEEIKKIREEVRKETIDTIMQQIDMILEKAVDKILEEKKSVFEKTAEEVVEQ
ncbi:hypothetical protein DRP05_15280 [Archaeoglobales archaeon]|nr:MAG: hypothetical protein DRP05_15280 [Archaeoglobales archaeon]